jgi:AraC-like DNA-binding protein
VAGAYLQPLLQVVADHGVALSELAVTAELSPRALSPLPDALDADAYVRLLDAGASLTHLPHFGLQVGERVRLGTYSVYGLILLSCRDFGEVLRQTLRFESLAHDLGHSTLQVMDDSACYAWHSRYPHASRHLAESVFAGVRVFGNWLAGRELPPAQVAFTHAQPDDCSEHLRIFGPDVHFDASTNCARFDAALLSLPVPNADVGLSPVLQQHAATLMREKMRANAEADIVTQVRARIAHNLAHNRAGLVAVAQDLNQSTRTLQRKLSDAGSSFQQLLDATRQSLAQTYLSQRDLSLADIAFLLGFQDQSAFTHAFREWTQDSPGNYREKLAQKST